MTTASTTDTLHVIKLGGSLLDLPDFPQRFTDWRQTLPRSQRLVMVVGGGETADVVRRFDHQFHLSQEQGHWLAIRAMQFNAHCINQILPDCQLTPDASSCSAIWKQGAMAIVDPIPWLEGDEAKGVMIPHRWSFTSDSIAAHLAVQLQASRLTLLKSTLPDGPVSAWQAAALGVVDPDFPQACQGIPLVELLNLRTNPIGRCVLAM